MHIAFILTHRQMLPLMEILLNLLRLMHLFLQSETWKRIIFWGMRALLYNFIVDGALNLYNTHQNMPGARGIPRDFCMDYLIVPVVVMVIIDPQDIGVTAVASVFVTAIMQLWLQD